MTIDSRDFGANWPTPIYVLVCILLIALSPALAPLAVIWWVGEWLMDELRNRR